MLFLAECSSNNDCPYNKACINEKCLNPCTNTDIRCGRGAECLVQNHLANCVCPAGTQGNPIISCVTGVCQYNEDCASHEICDRLNRVCVPVCDDTTCAQNADCIGRNHEPHCNCRPGTTGNPYIECSVYKDTEIIHECVVDGDCASKLACFDNKCKNPCQITNICGVDQTCSVIDTLPVRTMICECPSDMINDGSGRCVPIKRDEFECINDSDCNDNSMCTRGICILACNNQPCGINALCLSAHHRAVCQCAEGYEGNPLIECSSMPKTPTQYPAECSRNEDCPIDEACQSEKCINPCLLDNSCGKGALCHGENHIAICRCPLGYNGNPRQGCIPPNDITIGCRSNSDCSQSESCVNDHCVNPCNCGENSECFVKNHHPTCYCKPGYSGNSLFGCFKLGCQRNEDCDSTKQCFNSECIDPCMINDPCAINAECYGLNHRSSCRCPLGLEGNPFEKCERAECNSDFECPSYRSCIQKHCIDPCALDNPCAQNAICSVINHAASCKCPDNLPIGNPLSYCEKKVPVENQPECLYDKDCPSKLACISNTCVNPCDSLEPCKKSAICSVLDSVPVKTMICECPSDYIPDIEGECRKIKWPVDAGCIADSDCSDKEACINRQCRSPCNCGNFATCDVQNHRATCSCDRGYEGNPNIGCRTVGCRTDSECDSGKACVNGNCISPCLVSDPCGINAECYLRDNRQDCRCLSGYRGNPYEQCHVIGCRSNSDCPSEKQCENAQCINPCIYKNPCSTRAECKPQNHMAVCKCPTGTIGNPYIDCRTELLPECERDTDCPSKLACLSNKCQNPCSVLEPCQSPSRCEVVPSSPVRTMICICPEGYVSSGSGTCKPTKPVIEIGECIVDSDCPNEKACLNGICRDPCNCGINAECRIKDHKPVCSCKQGYDGNPQLECVKIGCTSDRECSGTHTCLNRQCIPACAADGSSCGRDAECYGINHKPVCECISGYSGNPKIACILLGCRSDTDCPFDKACINQKCENPCEKTAVCAVNEICQVYRHRAECSCPPGWVGDFERGCSRQQDEICRYDEDCPSQTACIGGECVNPCNATEPCGVNSLCTVLDTVPVRTMICECLPGFQGNAAIQCDKSKLYFKNI